MEMTLRNGLKVSSAAESQCRNFNTTMAVTSEGARKKQIAREDRKKILYKNETTFTFEKYVTNIKGIFNVLEKYGVPLY